MSSSHESELTILMPCLDEAETLGVCIDAARAYLERSGIDGEVVVADNGSTDGSQRIAEEHGARVVPVAQRGYGSALIGGTEAARGRYVVMGDADDSYDFASLDPFVERLRAGDDLVMGNRFTGGIEPGAMPPLHRYLGNPVLSWIGRTFFHTPIGDFHCGLRGFNRASIGDLHLLASGMEFASEMVIKASLGGLRVSEVPTTLRRDGRSRPPHLRSWRDGWRHLRLLLIFSPRWLFLIPGSALLLLGLIGTLVLSFGPVVLGDVGFDVASQLYCAALAIVGYQSLVFALLTKIYAQHEGFRIPRSRSFDRLERWVSLESAALIGVVLFLAGLVIGIVQFAGWGDAGFGALDAGKTVRVTVAGVLLLILGAQTVMAGMFLGVLAVPVKRR